ncbi:MAG TPA: TetR/AcrR family transcriptional regulator [Candidatus Ruania gallistercoris]|uniref:TetR/AcrR family transcriptional regulator n=1 Tax=Candidatus Ruania gallistercoris TaxID=2838746 RepID=A0A9D2J5X2_9MICO|nr:TetR/AcrR family transcriptional regulator [Candidatus Ruania gallistercoris]
MADARRTPRQERSRETVDVVLEAAAQLFERHGYATTTNHIAERAGVSVGSIYQYFPNKGALVTAIASRHLEEAALGLGEVSAALEREGAGLRVVLETLIEAVARMHTDRPVLHRFLFDEAPRTPELISRFRAMERELAQAFAGHLRRLGLGDGEPDFVALLTVQAIEAQVHGALLDAAVPDDPAARIRIIVDLWVRALES